MGQEAMSLREVLSDERRLSGSYPAMHCASAQRPPGGVGEFIDAEVPNLHRSASVWGRGQGYFIRWGETETGASLLISKAQTSAEKRLIQGRVKYNRDQSAFQHAPWLRQNGRGGTRLTDVSGYQRGS